MKKVLLPVPADPTVSFSVSLGVGAQNDPPGLEGLAWVTGRLVSEGATASHSFEEILELLYPLAAGYDMRIDREQSTLTGRTHRDNLAAFTELYVDALLQPAFTAEDFARIKSEAVNYISNTLRYSSDEDLAKAVLYGTAFAGTRYAHPEQGTLSGLAAITLDDVRGFHAEHYNQANLTVALGGGYDLDLVTALEARLAALPNGNATPQPPVEARRPTAHELVLVDKPGADASISFGFPLGVQRGERDFYALWLANSWLGEHRNGASHLFQVIRETRGLNYGDYSYIEAFPEGGERQMPPVNVARRRQLFEVWIRSLPNHQAQFALRAAVRELTLLVERGLSEDQFELTRSFLRKYSAHFAATTSERLGYAVDDGFYGIGGEGHLERFRRMMDELTLDEVNAAVRRHLRPDALTIAIVTGDAAGLAAALAADNASPLSYPDTMPAEVLAEDEAIAAFPLPIDASRISVLPVGRMFD